MSIYSKLALAATAVNAVTLALDELPADTQYKEFILKEKLNQKVLHFLQLLNSRVITPTSALLMLYALFRLVHQRSFIMTPNSIFNNIPVTDNLDVSLNQQKEVKSTLSGLPSIYQHARLANNLHPALVSPPLTTDGHITTFLANNTNIPPRFDIKQPQTLAQVFKSAPDVVVDPNGFQHVLDHSHRHILAKAATLPKRTPQVSGSRIINLFNGLYKRVRYFFLGPKHKPISYSSLFVVSAITLITSHFATKFLWRLRDNIDAYLYTDNSALTRDIIEWESPYNFWFYPLYILGWLTNPTVIGIEKLLPYVNFQTTISPADSRTLYGITLLKDKFQPFIETIRTNPSDLSTSINIDFSKIPKTAETTRHIITSPKNRTFQHVLNHKEADTIVLPPFSPITYTSLHNPRETPTHNDEPRTPASMRKYMANKQCPELTPSILSKTPFLSSTDAQLTSSSVHALSLLSPTQRPSFRPKTQQSYEISEIEPFGSLPFRTPFVAPHYTPKPTIYKQLLDFDRKPRCILFVSNHTILGFDMVVLQWVVNHYMNTWLRGLAHKGHCNFPIWRELLHWVGGFSGTRELCKVGMDYGMPMMVFPGGGREIMRKCTEGKYDLFWSQRTGFAKMAIDHSAVIVPVASVGNADMWNHYGDLNLKCIYGKHSLPEMTIPLDISEKYLVECEMIRVRAGQMVEYGIFTEDQASQWEQYHLTLLTDAYHQQQHMLDTIYDESPSTITKDSIQKSPAQIDADETKQDKSFTKFSTPLTKNNLFPHTPISTIHSDQHSIDSPFSPLAMAPLSQGNLPTKSQPLPKLRQPGASYDDNVSFPICHPTFNPFNLQRFYFTIGDPIDCLEYKGLGGSELACRHLRDRVKTALESGIKETVEFQQNDPNRYTYQRVASSLSTVATAVKNFFSLTPQTTQ